ncbi:28949_t:CDS:2 [Gigaspora margarita]|uniref:28949_t:CDS:1 n=1 Tax=Gigaspora margarita TaxID=4874 RepID=A0ABN7VH97_GIGMA|nr:28949_t:CDS:2 [Gigaspora margarita]
MMELFVKTQFYQKKTALRSNHNDKGFSTDDRITRIKIPKQQIEQDNMDISSRETNETTQKRQTYTNEREHEITPIMKLTTTIPIMITAPETTTQHRWPDTSKKKRVASSICIHQKEAVNDDSNNDYGTRDDDPISMARYLKKRVASSICIKKKVPKSTR